MFKNNHKKVASKNYILRVFHFAKIKFYCSAINKKKLMHTTTHDTPSYIYIYYI